MKLVTWNVQWFCGLDNVVSAERVIDEARSMADFDVLCLQEVAVNYPQLSGNAGFDQVARVRQLLPGFQVYFGAAVNELGRDGQNQQFGNLIATRLAVTQVQHDPLPYPADIGVRSMPRMCSSTTLLTALGPLRVMTTHLEFYSKRQRMAQAQALVALHSQACAQAAQPPLDDESGGPFQNKVHTASALLCGDFNFELSDPEYACIQQDEAAGAPGLSDAWRVLHGDKPHDPTFRLFDRRYGPEPVCCDFVFVSENLKRHVKKIKVNAQTCASDHQPLLIEME